MKIRSVLHCRPTSTWLARCCREWVHLHTELRVSLLQQLTIMMMRVFFFVVILIDLVLRPRK